MMWPRVPARGRRAGGAVGALIRSLGVSERLRARAARGGSHTAAKGVV